MENQARVSVSLREGKIEVSGSEVFVNEQLDRFQDLIDGKLAALPAAQPLPSAPPLPTPDGDCASPAAPTEPQENPYPNVIAIEEGQVNILKAIPGGSKAKQMVNATLLYLVGLGLTGETTGDFRKIRELCKHHSCLDSKNFSLRLKEAKQFFIVAGSHKSQTAKLTHPGATKAKALAAELNQE